VGHESLQSAVAEQAAGFLGRHSPGVSGRIEYFSWYRSHRRRDRGSSESKMECQTYG
jgi:hypothetical protein